MEKLYVQLTVFRDIRRNQLWQCLEFGWVLAGRLSNRCRQLFQTVQDAVVNIMICVLHVRTA